MQILLNYFVGFTVWFYVANGGHIGLTTGGVTKKEGGNFVV